MRITVIGSGYVGLVAGACLANVGNDVVCADIDAGKVARLTAGEVPFYEPGLEGLVQENVAAGRLRFTTDVERACRDGGIIFIAVGTPQGDDGSAELRFVESVAETIGRALASGENVMVDGQKVVLTKSTVPVGTTDRVSEIIGRTAKQGYVCCSNPEFLKEGDAVNDFLKPDRVVIGTDDPHALEVLGRLYAPFTRQRNRIQSMSPKSAEIVKYAANALLATKISFMNEVARLCDAAGGDVEHVRAALGADSRIGYQFLYPGLGFGGSCFPKDTRAFVRTGEELGVPLRITEAAMLANAEPVRDLLRHMAEDLGGLAGRAIAVWGLAFKPRTDDVREAASLRLIAGLLAEGATVRATDPEALETAREALGRDGLAGRIELVGDQLAACAGADALVIATEWNEYRNPDFEALAGAMRGRAIFDGRNILPPEAVTEAGFDYRGVGRPRFRAKGG